MAKKTLIDLTPEIRSKIEQYKKDCVTDLYNGNEWSNWKRKDTVDYIEYVYKLGKQKEKPVVIIADSLLQYRQFFNLLFNNEINKKYTRLVNIIHAVKNNTKVKNVKLNSELDSELNSDLHGELRSELSSELGSELDSELDSELYSELHSELNSELRSELDSELRSALYSELSSDLNSELRSDLDSELRSALYSELNSELHNDLYSDLNSELRSELRRKIDKKEFNKPASYHYLFLTYEYSRVYLMWYKFIQDEFKLKTKKGKELNWLFNNVKKSSISKTFLCKNICLVLRMPKVIMRNNIGFHDTTIDGAIRYKKEKLYYINGRSVPSWVFEKYFNKTLTFNDFIKEQNEDIKAGIIVLIKENEGNEGLLKFLNAIKVDEQILIHEGGYTETVRLYKTKEKYLFLQNSKGEQNQPYAWTEMTCPSTNQVYLIDTCPTFINALDSLKFHRPKHIKSELEYRWQSAS